MLYQIKHRVKKLKIRLSVKTCNSPQSTEIHLFNALLWFKNSLHNDGGSSAKYSLLENHYSPSYPETTGYWLNTLYLSQQHYPQTFTQVFGTQNIQKELAEWLLSIQRLDGTFPGSYGNFLNQPPRVFNTGQIIFGLLEYFERTNDNKILVSIKKAADWLIQIQSNDGCWYQFTDIQYSSNTRTALALMMLGKISGKKKYYEAGVKNIEYALSLQNKHGYFLNNGFDKKNIPYTHTIAYAIQGILEAAIGDNNNSWVEMAKKSFDSLFALIQKDGFLSGQIDENYLPIADYCCLTGNCQLSIIAFTLYHLTQETKYHEVGTQLLNFVKAKQLKSTTPQLNGGILGSWPVSGNYNPYEIPNWAAKFFIDALVKEKFSYQ